MPQIDAGLLQFTKGSGFEQHAVKQLVGDEFKFVLNDYPDICKFAVASDQFRTAKLRIYKVYTQKQDDVRGNIAGQPYYQMN